MYSQQFTFTQIKAVATKARAISQFVHLCSGFVQIRFVAAELIRHSFTLCVCAGRVWRLRSDKAVENPWLERKRGEQAWHWASALDHHADQCSQRDCHRPLKGLCWAQCFSPFLHGNKTLAVTVSIICLSCSHCWICKFPFPWARRVFYVLFCFCFFGGVIALCSSRELC